ncbi:helix-turn-helix domain-containing protein [Paenibacillus glycanilyticus]|uniref:HTH-type transcriptional regulator YesS n=1 Tax=Paenibacillus glycanilyticus TaxID=126569 RepID=A0ABQ6GB57_9BACL|nr:helix-turn-helix domain-containing protein [Paenibacillus glycanilyticus]GLX66551.1 HTH-type transcriptional regulator YesS [Paenibacillus glycanilyticus]
MKRFPMMLQLMLILICVMAIPTAILTWYSGTQIVGYSESAIAETSLAGLNANRELNENALSNLAQDAVQLAATNIFDRLRGFQTYSELNSDYSDISSALKVLNELASLNHRVDGVYSTYFLLDGADYVVSTDQGITTLDRYEQVAWMEQALDGRRGIAGVWFPRRLESGLQVVSYVLPLNRLSTTTRGTIVVNLREKQIANYLNSSEPGSEGYMLLSSDGTIISHHDKSLLLSDGNKQPFIRQILSKPVKEGYAYHTLNGERLLYTWSRSEQLGWWNINIYSMDQLMTKTYNLQRSIIFITAIIIFAGTILAVLLATWLSQPLRKLVRTMRERTGLGTPGNNELAFLESAFRRMQEEEEGLHSLLQEREQDTRSLSIHQLLRGEVKKQIAEMFPERYYTIAVVSIDRYRRYVSKNNPETRSYNRYLLLSKCESLFPANIHARGIYQGEGNFVFVMNYVQDEGVMSGLKDTLVRIRDAALDLLGHSVTTGVSSQTEFSELIPERVAEAAEAIKQRMIKGSGCIFYWQEESERSKKYMYPTNSERRIVNFLERADLDSILGELNSIRLDIISDESISHDNILFIYNQMIGVTIKHLRENNISTSRIFAGRGNIYSAIAALDTLDELENYLRDFFKDIISHLERNTGEANHGDRIIRYLEENFCKEIVFEEMAKEIGISYSYMRKIVYELTGKSLIDYTNHLRIEKAKQLLAESNMTITQIASEVGYYNVQSFNRFFRKYEGMPPSSYKTSRAKTS